MVKANVNRLPDYESAARSLANEHANNKKNMIKEVWLFPDESQTEIRLVEISPTAFPSQERITAFRFPPFPGSRYPFWIALAEIRPEERERLDPPRGWVDWTQAKKIWPEKVRAAKKVARRKVKP